MSAAPEPSTAVADLRARVMAMPRKINLEIVSECNLRCRYCYYFDNENVDYRDLPTEDWLRFFEECGAAGVMQVIVAGGEPFMRKDLRTLLEGIVRNRMRYAFLSNGALIKDDIAAYMASTKRCDYIQISIDGSCAEVHDSMRGKRSFERAVRGIKTLQKHGIRVAIRVTIHRKNVHDLENIARFLLEDLNLPSFGTNSASVKGSCAVNADEVLLSIEERQLAMETLLRLSDQYPGRITASAGPLADARMWRRMEEARLRNDPAFSNGGCLTGCGCHRSEISVRADGAYSICAFLADEVLGYVNRDSLLDIWQHSSGLERMRSRHTIPLTTFESCSTCEYAPYCTGNCPGLAYTETGISETPSPDGCLQRFLKAGGTIPGIDTHALQDR